MDWRWRSAGHAVEELGRDGGDASGADVLLLAGLGPFFYRCAKPGEL